MGDILSALYVSNLFARSSPAHPLTLPPCTCFRLLALPALLALVLIVLMHCNNYITTRYFHTSEVSLALSFLISVGQCVCPLCVYTCLRQCGWCGVWQSASNQNPIPLWLTGDTQESVMSLVCGGLLFEIPGSIFFYLTRRRWEHVLGEECAQHQGKRWADEIVVALVIHTGFRLLWRIDSM